jgi:membrane protease YdiL (CAAX protease family)
VEIHGRPGGDTSSRHASSITMSLVVSLQRLASGSTSTLWGALTITAQRNLQRGWAKLPVAMRAIITGVAIGLSAANVWPPLLVGLGVPLAAPTEMVFLALYVWWASGAGPPLTTRAARGSAFRNSALSPAQWSWGLVAALSFAATVHASIALLFRFVSFPIEAFREGYDLSFIPSLGLKWVAVVVSAASAGICEETGFRGYMQQPIEQRSGAPIAILVSSLFFMLLRLTKAWALVGMVPIVFGAGVLLGLFAWASGSLIPGMIGHVVMDIGLFAYWWTGIAGDFTAQPIRETGVDQPFLITCALLAITLLIVLLATWRLRGINRFPSDRVAAQTCTAAR